MILNKNSNWSLRPVAACAATIIALIALAHSQTAYTFTDNSGGTQDWTDGTNWSGGLAPNTVSGDTISMNLTMASNTDLNLGADRTFANWTSNFGGFGGTVFTINSGFTVTLAGTAPTITHNGKGSVVFDAIVAGTDGLIKAGSQNLTLNNASNSFSGGITLQSGVLTVASDAALGDAGNNIDVTGSFRFSMSTNSQTVARDFTLSSGATLQYSDKNTFTISGAVTGLGGMRVSASGFGNQDFNLSSTSNSFTGALQLGQGDTGVVFTTNSFADSANSITMRNGSKGDTKFVWGSGATSALVLNSRQFVISGSGNKKHVIENANANASNTITINQDFSVTRTTNQSLVLGGINTGNNTIAGAISDGDGSITTLEKVGSGNWTVTGANTYTGNTIVSAGSLTLGDGGQFLFDIGSSGVNNQLTGSATLNLDGELVFDLTAASTTISDFWQIVDVSGLTESYGATFGVSSTLGSFTADGGGDLWTISENGVGYEFSESTGMLTVVPIPEPGIFALSALGGLMLLRRRRK
ncbi:MAG: autotransporter-associated beta strand repeat-containing protein [Luteolibacter sp.]